MDLRIICAACNQPFSFSESAQQHYQEHGFQTPKRCKTCRDSKPKKPVRKAAPPKRREPEIIRLRPHLSAS